MVNKLFYASLACGILFSATSCEDQKFNDTFRDAERVQVDTLSAEMQKVRDYVPEYALMAHRGSTFWTPEETEAAYRWAREMGADYLECDLQVSKDGVLLALHDTDLKRTTNIEEVFGERFPEELRREYYEILYQGVRGEKGTEAHDAYVDSLIRQDIKYFVPNYPSNYTYYELMHLDAGKWFNQDNPEVAREGFVARRQYISTLEDLIMYSKGYRLERYNDGLHFTADVQAAPENNLVWGGEEKARGQRLVRKMAVRQNGGKNVVITNPVNFYTVDAVVDYEFAYKKDETWGGNIPGIYIEFKEPWLNPAGFEQMVYDKLAAVQDMNILTSSVAENEPFYVEASARGTFGGNAVVSGNGKVVNVGETRGKVVLQTFSLQSLVQVSQVFKGEVPMCFLLWLGSGATDLTYDDPEGYASFINLAVEYKAHYIGPCIAGAPNNYPELNYPWQHYLIHRAKMENHPYSFDTYDQMAKYFGDYNWGATGGTRYQAPYADAFFTNHTDMSLQYLYNFGYRDQEKAPYPVLDPNEVLDKLGYHKN